MILRVDDRYVHGQVIAGWVRPLGISHLILASDEIAADEWARNTYALAVPDNVKFSVASLDDLITKLGEKRDKTMIVVGSIKEALALIERGLTIREVDLGCVGYDDGKCEVCSYIYLSHEEIEYARAIDRKGIKVQARALPNCPITDVMKALRAGKH